MVIHYKEGSGSDAVTVIQQQKLMASKQEGTRSRRDVEKRSKADLKKFECGEGMGCSIINCTLGFLHDDESVDIRIKAKIWTPTLLLKRIRDPFHILSQGVVRVASMPHRDLKIAPYTKTIAMYVVDTYVNPEKLIPPPSGIEPWIIGVSVSAGLLLLFLLIVLLWWCGFFRRKKREGMMHQGKKDINGKAFE